MSGVLAFPYRREQRFFFLARRLSKGRLQPLGDFTHRGRVQRTAPTLDEEGIRRASVGSSGARS